tara:strand:- start:1932 stop:3557 length:1626 start_codon:yes stop_codon:yes gene_type:complete
MLSVLKKITPPNNIDNLRKKFGVGKYRNNKSTIRKKLIKNGDLTENPLFSFKEDGNTKKVIITYTKLIPSKNDKGIYIRDGLGNPKMKKSNSIPHYCNEFKLPFTETTFEYFVLYVINFQKELNIQNRETQNLYSQSSPLIDVYINDFIKSKKGMGVLEKTINSYEYVLGYFLLFLKRNNIPSPPFIFNKHQIENVKQSHPQLKVGLDTDYTSNMKIDEFEGMNGKDRILDWITILQTKNRIYGGVKISDETKLTSIKSYWVIVRCFFNWLDSNRYIKDNPIKYITKNDLPQFSIYESNLRNQLTPTDGDIDILCKWILNERDNPPKVGRWDTKRKEFQWLLPMLMVYLKCGIRNQTLCDLELKNVDWDRNQIKYKSKFGREGFVYLDDDLKEWLKPLIIDETTNKVITNRVYIFEGKKGNKFNNNFISTYFRKIRIEIKSQNPQFNENITIHSFRRYYINKMLRNGVSLSLIRKSVNHNSYDILRKYETDTIMDDELPHTTLPSPNLDEDSVSVETKKKQLHKELEKIQRELDYMESKNS